MFRSSVVTTKTILSQYTVITILWWISKQIDAPSLAVCSISPVKQSIAPPRYSVKDGIDFKTLNPERRMFQIAKSFITFLKMTNEAHFLYFCINKIQIVVSIILPYKEVYWMIINFAQFLKRSFPISFQTEKVCCNAG